uniref:Uncharacterized protein n=1 Tax=Physcomitrium patens TaxID=3218 RepID=A0A7I4E741_PHYPA
MEDAGERMSLFSNLESDGAVRCIFSKDGSKILKPMTSLCRRGITCSCTYQWSALILSNALSSYDETISWTKV